MDLAEDADTIDKDSAEVKLGEDTAREGESGEVKESEEGASAEEESEESNGSEEGEIKDNWGYEVDIDVNVQVPSGRQRLADKRASKSITRAEDIATVNEPEYTMIRYEYKNFLRSLVLANG